MATAIAALPLHRLRCQARGRAHGMRWSPVLGLVLALQFMQILGLLHGIAHAGWPPAMEQGVRESINAALFDYLDGDTGEAGTAGTVSGTSTDTAQVTGPDQNSGDHHHSCVEYDAAAGAVGVHVPFFVPPLLPSVRVLALWQAFASWDAPFARHFSSRAPPC